MQRSRKLTPLRGRFSIYRDLRVFLTRKSARISPCLEGFCSLCLRKSNIFNRRSKSLGWEFGRFPLFPKFRSQACQGFGGFVKLGFWADFGTYFGVSSFIIRLIYYATITGNSLPKTAFSPWQSWFFFLLSMYCIGAKDISSKGKNW